MSGANTCSWATGRAHGSPGRWCQSANKSCLHSLSSPLRVHREDNVSLALPVDHSSRMSLCGALRSPAPSSIHKTHKKDIIILPLILSQHTPFTQQKHSLNDSTEITFYLGEFFSIRFFFKV